MYDFKRAPRGRPRKLENPEELWEHFLGYIEHAKNNPRYRHQLAQKTATMVKEEIQVPLTYAGFDAYLAYHNIISRLEEYRTNRRGTYGDFAEVVTRIESVIQGDLQEGSLLGLYNGKLYAHLYADKKEGGNGPAIQIVVNSDDTALKLSNLMNNGESNSNAAD